MNQIDEKTKALVEGYLYALDTIHAEQKQLEAKAKRVADEFWSFHHANNPKRPFNKRSQLACRVRHANGNVVRIEWMRTHWNHPSSMSNKPYYEYITKGRGAMRYSVARLRQLAQDWEWDIVERCEDAFADIRAQSNEIGRIRTALHAHLKRLGVDIGSAPDRIDDDD